MRTRLRAVFVALLDLAGVGALTGAAWSVAPALGLAVAGVGALVFAYMIEPRGGRR